MTIDLAFATFVLASLVLFRFVPANVAVVATVLGGWIVLPVGHYPDGAAMAVFPYWITGSAVPSDMLLTKAWVAPACALFGVLAFDARTLLGLRPRRGDLPIALWCAWPLLQSAFVPDARPAGWIASLYLLGSWGVPWLLGRAYLSNVQGRLVFLRGLVISALACLPFSIVEGVFGPRLYGAVYETHPFRHDGDLRYIGYRPLGFFENGNQFAIWIALAALAAIWLARTAAGARWRHWDVAAAVLLVAMTLASQSVGAIALLGAGVALLALSRRIRMRSVAAVAVAGFALAGAVYLSGALPIARIAKETAFGRHAVDALRAVGRGSFAWRISQDQKLLADATARPAVGAATWDWWRAKESRPWGLALLIVGQFGLTGLLLSFGALLWPALRAAWTAPRASPWRPPALPLVLATLVVMATLDGLLNSFVFMPAALVAGGLATHNLEP